MVSMLADFPQGRKVIDVGCSTGEMLEVLDKYKFKAFGLDFSFKILEAIAKSELGHHWPLITFSFTFPQFLGFLTDYARTFASTKA